MKRKIFGALDASQFLHRHWQKKPLVVRNALPKHAERITRARLFELAARDEIESRVVTRARERWTVRHGPFASSETNRAPRANWTLLVQGVDQIDADAARLLREFSFISYARLDDVMVSYAAPGGGVGPHFDTYDVFLVQTTGRRRWKVSRPRDFALEPDAPLKIIRGFEAEREWVLEPGDVLYVPPRWAHDGIAIDECITCSVGFRAPAAQELASGFLAFLEDEIRVDGRYCDPDLTPTRTPGRIDARMLTRLSAMLRSVRWSKADEKRFIGTYLSEPKPSVVFRRPARPLTRAAFERTARARGLRLAPTTRMLYSGRWIFMNGDAYENASSASLRTLADKRVLPPGAIEAGARQFLYDAYLTGHLALA